MRAQPGDRTLAPCHLTPCGGPSNGPRQGRAATISTKRTDVDRRVRCTWRLDGLLSHILMNESCRPFPIDAYVVSAGAVVHTLNRFRPHLPATRDPLLRAEEIVRFCRVIHVHKGESADELLSVDPVGAFREWVVVVVEPEQQRIRSVGVSLSSCRWCT